jgi:sulfatase maturation enzyme AslB (radical SAM superfamily)
LLEFGADPNFKDVKDGRSALQWAKKPEIKDMLTNFKLVSCANESCAKVEKVYKQFARCSRCKSVAYCGGACQLADWKATHQEACKKFQLAAAAAVKKAASAKKTPQSNRSRSGRGRKGKGRKR